MMAKDIAELLDESQDGEELGRVLEELIDILRRTDEQTDA